MSKYRPRVKVGDTYGRLEVLSLQEKRKQHNTWLCRCDCGNEVSVYATNLQTGHTKSCGCLNVDFCVSSFSTHQMSQTRFYAIWKHIKDRCNNPLNPAWKDYGGRGINVCDKWDCFEGFFEDMFDDYRDNLTIEREDPNGNYCKENCTWIPRPQQSLNKTRHRNNKTGVTGVSYRERDNAYVVSWIDINRKQKSKTFSCKKFGDALAFKLACEFRTNVIEDLRLHGVDYSRFNGTDKKGYNYEYYKTDVGV